MSQELAVGVSSLPAAQGGVQVATVSAGKKTVGGDDRVIQLVALAARTGELSTIVGEIYQPVEIPTSLTEYGGIQSVQWYATNVSSRAVDSWTRTSYFCNSQGDEFVLVLGYQNSALIDGWRLSTGGDRVEPGTGLYNRSVLEENVIPDLPVELGRLSAVCWDYQENRLICVGVDGPIGECSDSGVWTMWEGGFPEVSGDASIGASLEVIYHAPTNSTYLAYAPMTVSGIYSRPCNYEDTSDCLAPNTGVITFPTACAFTSNYDWEEIVLIEHSTFKVHLYDWEEGEWYVLYDPSNLAHPAYRPLGDLNPVFYGKYPDSGLLAWSQNSLWYFPANFIPGGEGPAYAYTSFRSTYLSELYWADADEYPLLPAECWTSLSEIAAPGVGGSHACFYWDTDTVVNVGGKFHTWAGAGEMNRAVFIEYVTPKLTQLLVNCEDSKEVLLSVFIEVGDPSNTTANLANCSVEFKPVLYGADGRVMSVGRSFVSDILSEGLQRVMVPSGWGSPQAKYFVGSMIVACAGAAKLGVLEVASNFEDALNPGNNVGKAMVEATVL